MTEQGTVPVAVSWRRIERWLAAYAQADREQLNPPATREEIEAAEHVLGFPLPVELPQSLFEHGVVLSQKDGARLKLFRVGQMRIQNTNDRIFLLAGPQGQAGCMSAQWSDGTVLAKALTRWAFSNPWT